MGLSAKAKRRHHDIRKALTFIESTGMRAYVSGYDVKARKVIVAARYEEGDLQRAKDGLADWMAVAAGTSPGGAT